MLDVLEAGEERWKTNSKKKVAKLNNSIVFICCLIRFLGALLGFRSIPHRKEISGLTCNVIKNDIITFRLFTDVLFSLHSFLSPTFRSIIRLHVDLLAISTRQTCARLDFDFDCFPPRRQSTRAHQSYSLRFFLSLRFSLRSCCADFCVSVCERQ